MSDWKKTSYGIPKTWAEIQHEKREAELEKVSASPVPMLLWIGFLGLLFAACVIGFILSFLR